MTTCPARLLRMPRVARATAVTAALLASLAGAATAHADLPAALDRVPGKAPVVVVVRDLESVYTRFSTLAKSMNVSSDEDDDNPLSMAGKMLEAKGLKRNGSVAFVIVQKGDEPVNFESENPPFVILVPVTDYSAFVKGLGAAETSGIASMTIEDKPAFAKDLGGGYAAIAHDKPLLEGFEGEGGHKAEHAKMFGAGGGRTADTADVLIIANIPMLQAQLTKGVAEMKERGEMMAMMAGPAAAQAAGPLKLAQVVSESFIRDAQVGIMGLGLGEQGLWIDLSAQFKEGSEIAGFFDAKGKASKLVSRLPNVPFLFAGAFDLSAPGLKKIARNIGAIQAEAADAAAKSSGAEAPPTAGGITAMLNDVDNIDGASFVVGASPGGIMGGVFANTSYYIATKNPEKYIASARESMIKADGTAAGGITFKNEYKASSEEIGGVKVDTWSMKMNMDPNDPNAAQMQMVQGMIFGPGGMSGYTAPVDGGVVMTMSQNRPLMTVALESARTGEKGLTQDSLLTDAQAKLPEGRAFEFFLGTKSIMDTIGGLMQMMGGGQAFPIPAKLSPIAVGGTTDGGGVQLRTYIPTDVLQAMAEAGKAAQGDDDEDDMDDDGDAPAKAPGY